MRDPEVADAVLSEMLGSSLRRDVPIGLRTTYKVGGPARWFVEIANQETLQATGAAIAATGVATLVLGVGSNLLVADSGFDGLVIELGDAFASIEIDGSAVRAGAAARLPVVARRTVQAGLTGFEWAVGVPGSVGGAVRMNAGGHGSDMAASLRSIRVLDLESGQDRTVPASRLELGYRSSAVRSHHLVVHADLQLEVGDPEHGAEMLSEIVSWRRANQPGGQNAGSVFTNPPGDSAGHLIETAGLKGHRCGTAQVSPKHANFVQVDDGGSADDVLMLMQEIRRRVEERHGIRLEAETRIVGYGPGVDRR